MIETHWICDVCGKRTIGSGDTENVNETEIQEWYVVSLQIGRVRGSFSGPSQLHKHGYACSDKCVRQVADDLRELGMKRIKGTTPARMENK